MTSPTCHSDAYLNYLGFSLNLLASQVSIYKLPYFGPFKVIQGMVTHQ